MYELLELYARPHDPVICLDEKCKQLLRETHRPLPAQPVGMLEYHDYLNLLQVSSVHVYLTYPFVLSWSFIEAMACGCLIVGSRTPPVLEVLRDGVNGLTVDFFCAQGAR